MLSAEYGTLLKEESVIKGKPNSLKYNGASEEKQICLFVCANELSGVQVDAGQLDSILRRCYLLSLSPYRKKLLVFTNKDFYEKFVEKYLDYLVDIETIYKESLEQK